MRYDSYPTYLYDDKYLNDAEYIYNNHTIFEYLLTNTILYTLRGNKTTSFDEYANWHSKYKFDKGTMLKKYEYVDRKKKKEGIGRLSEEDKATIKANIEQNWLTTARDNPKVQFYAFIPPYSIIYYYEQYKDGNVGRDIEAQRYATELLLEQENIHVFCFDDKYDITTNLNNYSDSMHYHERINSLMLEWMAKGEGRLTKENYIQFYDEIFKFYTTYNYEGIYK